MLQLVLSLVVFLLILSPFICFESEKALARDKEDLWVFLHYHKVGTVLLYHMLEPLKYNPIINPGQKLRLNLNDKNVTSVEMLSRIFASSDIAVLKVYDNSFHKMWTYAIGKCNKRVKLVHITRDPFELVLSAYLYHSKTDEMWAMSEQYITPFFDENLLSSSGQLDALNQLAISLRNKYDPHHNMSFQSYTRAAHENDDVFDAIRINALFELPYIQAMSSPYILPEMRNVYTAKMEDFDIMNENKYKDALKKMLDFLYSGGKSCSFCKAITKEILLQQIFNTSFPSDTNPDLHHVTRFDMREKLRNTYIQRLKLDPTLGPILNSFNTSIQSVSS